MRPPGDACPLLSNHLKGVTPTLDGDCEGLETEFGESVAKSAWVLIKQTLGTAAWSKWRSCPGHSWPPRARQTDCI